MVMNNNYEELRKKLFEHTRKKLKEEFTEDFFIIQTINKINDLNKILNTLSKRIREWANPFAPRMSLIKDHEIFLKELLKKEKADDFGIEYKEKDLLFLRKNIESLLDLYEEKRALLNYLEEKLKELTPNLLFIAGPTISAELIKLAGSIKRLALLPASTIQLLGAETSLFRHLRNKKSKPPKHGIIFNHEIIQRTPKKDRGKAARALADKISIAVKIDFFKGEFIADKLKKELEERFFKQS